MAFLQKKNNAKSTVADNPLLAGATTVNLPTGEGARIPAIGDFMATIWDEASFPDPGDDPNMEIVRGTAKSSDAIIITRAQEGTSAVEHALGSALKMLITAGTLNEHLNQNLKTTDSPTFAGLTITNGLIQVDDLSSQCNGSNKVFSLTQDAVIGSIILLGTQFPIVYKNTTDFTLTAANEITLTSEVNGPESGQTLIAMYEKK